MMLKRSATIVLVRFLAVSLLLCGCGGEEDQEEDTRSCFSHTGKQCFGGNLYWNNSCGNLEGLFVNCDCGCESASCLECDHTRFYSAESGSSWLPMPEVPDPGDVGTMLFQDESAFMAYSMDLTGKKLYEWGPSDTEWSDTGRDAPGKIESIYDDGNGIVIGPSFYKWDSGFKMWVVDSKYEFAPGTVQALYVDKDRTFIAADNSFYRHSQATSAWEPVLGPAPGEVEGLAIPGDGSLTDAVIAVGAAIYQWNEASWELSPNFDVPPGKIQAMNSYYADLYIAVGQ